MKDKINKPLLIISIAAAVLLIGISVMVTVYFDSLMGVLCGIVALALLVGFLLVKNICYRKK